MINLNRGSRLHPGWVCFLVGFGSGFFALMAFILLLNWVYRGTEPVSMLISGAMAIGLFIAGGMKAEKLRDTDVVAMETSSQERR